MDIIRTITKGIDHNRWTVIASVVAVVVAASILSMPGCQSETVGLDGTQVTATQLNQQAIDAQKDLQLRADALAADIEAAKEKLGAAYDDIAKQDATKAAILDFATTFGGGLLTGSVGVADAVPAAVSLGALLFAGGTLADNKRKDIVIKEAKGTVA